jgi:large subunit ribosomal protein L29
LKMDEIRALKSEELVKQLDDSYQELFNVRLRIATRQLANNREIPKIEKKIARIKTILRQRELGIG